MKVAIIGSGHVGSIGKAKMSLMAEVIANTAVFRISGRISEWSESNAKAFEQKVDEIIAQGITDLDIYLNTEGGSVLVANEIVNQMKKFTGNIKGKGGAIVASAGTYIAINCNTFSLAANGQFMIHKPMLYIDGNEDEIESNLKLLKNITADYKKQYAQKTGLTENQIESLWLKGDFWMNATEAKSKKFIDSIDGEEVITDEIKLMLEACSAPVIPKVTHSNSNMAVINPITIGLPENASEAQVQAKLKEMSDKAQEADRLKAEKESNDKAAKAANIKAILDKAVLDKKIKADQYSKWQKNLEADFETNKELIESLPSVDAISAHVNTDIQKSTTDKSAWTYQDWMDKDPEGLNKMRTEKEADFEKLMTAHYQIKG